MTPATPSALLMSATSPSRYSSSDTAVRGFGFGAGAPAEPPRWRARRGGRSSRGSAGSTALGRRLPHDGREPRQHGRGRAHGDERRERSGRHGCRRGIRGLRRGQPAPVRRPEAIRPAARARRSAPRAPAAAPRRGRRPAPVPRGRPADGSGSEGAAGGGGGSRRRDRRLGRRDRPGPGRWEPARPRPRPRAQAARPRSAGAGGSTGARGSTASGSNRDGRRGASAGSVPSWRAARRARKSLIPRPSPGTRRAGLAEREDLGLAPAVRARQPVDVVEQALRAGGELRPHEAGDVEDPPPRGAARRAREVDQQLGAGIVLGQRRRHRGGRAVGQRRPGRLDGDDRPVEQRRGRRLDVRRPRRRPRRRSCPAAARRSAGRACSTVHAGGAGGDALDAAPGRRARGRPARRSPGTARSPPAGRRALPPAARAAARRACPSGSRAPLGVAEDRQRPVDRVQRDAGLPEAQQLVRVETAHGGAPTWAR